MMTTGTGGARMNDRTYGHLLTLLRKEARGELTQEELGRLRRYVSKWDMTAYRHPPEEIVRLARLAVGMEYFLRLAEREGEGSAA